MRTICPRAAGYQVGADFWLMISLANHVYLATGSQGTISLHIHEVEEKPHYESYNTRLPL
jgi:hypothetical protein